jgi:DNA excision repair protein ERCC-2
MTYTVAVRALCEFTAKCGDLDLRFTPSPSAQEGIAGHAAVRSRRSGQYRSEVSLAGEYGFLQVRGRADGYDPVRNRIEEIKTYRGRFDAIPENHRQLHWAQARVYGWLQCRQLGLQEIHIALVYYEIDQRTETVLSELWTAPELEKFFNQACSRFLAWAEQERRHRIDRDAALRSLPFPHGGFRAGQRELAEAVYKSAASGRCVMAQAPTGIGKTIGTLFPLLKAGPGQELDKIFYLAAKTSGRELALDAVRLIQRADQRLPLRVVELVARDKACEHPDKACHGASCPLAQGFYDRLPAARSAMLDEAVMDKAATRRVALAHAVCPYYLSQEMVKWADMVVGDYNYYFDVSAMLYGMTNANQWRASVLVDEAHNLIDRARKMYSAELRQAGLRAVRSIAPAELKRPLERLNRQWNEIAKGQADTYRACAAIPDPFTGALQNASAALGEYLAEHPAGSAPELQNFHFEVLHFLRLAEVFGDHSLFDITKEGARGGTALCIRNIVPAPFLKPRFEASRSTALFSATLSPWDYYSDTLGLPDGTPWIEVASPFRPEQLSVQVMRNISTRYRDRAGSLDAIVDLMADQYAKRPGNYIAFFSSFDYLQQVQERFMTQAPQIVCWAQRRGMAEAEKEEFLANFRAGGAGIGFAVLGGAFGEGIDLAGDRLIGAFIATLGLPQLNEINEQIKSRMHAAFGAGYEYAYLYPGLQKVIQAAGRVIRTESDVGVVFLMDDRFAASEVRKLLPRWWDLDGALRKVA